MHLLFLDLDLDQRVYLARVYLVRVLVACQARAKSAEERLSKLEASLGKALEAAELRAKVDEMAAGKESALSEASAARREAQVRLRR